MLFICDICIMIFVIIILYILPTYTYVYIKLKMTRVEEHIQIPKFNTTYIGIVYPLH